MRVNLEISDENAKAFIDFIKTLDYVKISNDLEIDFTIPEWHKNLISERLESYKKNPDSAKDFEQTLKDLRKSL